MQAAVADRKYVVCNADEGDSGTFADRLLMEGDPFCLIEGMAIAGVATGAAKGFVYLRSEYPIAAEIFGRAIEVARAAGVLGASVLGSGQAFDLELRIGAGAYICGEETSMLESLEGKRAIVRAKPPISGAARAVRQADAGQQRDEFRRGAVDIDAWRPGLCRFRHGALARHAADTACGQCSPRRADRGRVRDYVARGD
ncbi:MAG: hypothetical protein WDN04_06430 [Rhodospirillales bacterium]